MWEDTLNDKLGMNCFNLCAAHASGGPAFVISIGGHRRLVPLLKQWQELISLGYPGNQEPSIAFPVVSYSAIPSFRNIFMNCKDKLLNNAKEVTMLKCQSDGGRVDAWLPDNKLKCSMVVMTFLLQSKWCLQREKKNLKISRKCKSLYEAVTFIITDNNWWFMRCHHSNQLLWHPLVPLIQKAWTPVKKFPTWSSGGLLAPYSVLIK